MSKNIKILLIPFFFLLVLHVQGQNHYLLSSFEAIKDNNRIILQWTIKQGGSCLGIGIFRSIDAQNFKLIGEILGNCGSTEFDQKYMYIDENPVKNTSNFYVLELGFSGKTAPPVSVDYFDLEKNSSLVFPNPSVSSDEVQIVFQNPNSGKHFLKVFDTIGKLIFTQTSDSDYFLFSKEIHLSLNTNINSTYFYHILNDRNTIVSSGKIIKL